MIDTREFDDFREIVFYQKRVKGVDLTKHGLDPQNPSQTQLNELLCSMPQKKIEIRIDPLFGNYSLHTTLISEERANRPVVIKPRKSDFVDSSSCDFCKPRVYSETAVPKIHHGGQQIVTAPNLFPFISPHFVTMFAGHKTSLEDLTSEDIANYLSSGMALARRLQDEGCNGMWDFINWGAAAGGSQPHPHSQRGGLYNRMISLMDKECGALRDRKTALNGEDPFEVYMDLVRKSPMLIYEDDDVFVFAPYAPRFTDQVDIFTKKKDRCVSNYLELDAKIIPSISKAMAAVLGDLSTKRGVTDLNVETHQARFNGSEDYRMHWHIYPRKSAIAGMELNDIYIVSAYPEDTARALSKPRPSIQ